MVILKKKIISPIWFISLLIALALSNVAYASNIDETINEPQTITNYNVANKTPYITVRAIGRVSKEPDMAIITLTVKTYNKSAQTALLNNDVEINTIIEALQAIGIEKKNLKTSGINIQKINKTEKSFLASSDKSEIEYFVNNKVAIQINDLKKLGLVLDKAAELDKNSSMVFSLLNSDKEILLDKARENAGKNAHKNASIIVEAAGGKLGRVLEITENQIALNSNSNSDYYNYDKKTYSSSSNTTKTGHLLYSVDISVTFEIIE